VFKLDKGLAEVYHSVQTSKQNFSQRESVDPEECVFWEERNRLGELLVQVMVQENHARGRLDGSCYRELKEILWQTVAQGPAPLLFERNAVSLMAKSYGLVAFIDGNADP
jgi:hypothetical protein